MTEITQAVTGFQKLGNCLKYKEAYIKILIEAYMRFARSEEKFKYINMQKISIK